MLIIESGRFLLESSNGQFLSPRVGHYDIAFACVSHLLQMLDFARGNELQPKLFVKVGLGIYGLQRYALEHWITHVLEFMAHDEEFKSKDSPLMAQATRLAQEHDRIPRRSILTSKEEFAVEISNFLSLRLERLRGFPEVFELVRKILSFRDYLDSREAAGDFGTCIAHSDTIWKRLTLSLSSQMTPSSPRIQPCFHLWTKNIKLLFDP